MGMRVAEGSCGRTLAVLVVSRSPVLRADGDHRGQEPGRFAEGNFFAADVGRLENSVAIIDKYFCVDPAGGFWGRFGIGVHHDSLRMNVSL